MNNFTKHFILILVWLAVPCLANAQLKVVATTADLASIAQEIGGKAVEVSSLARPTEDPHFVDAKPSFIVKLNRADVLIEGGAELEIGWLPALLEQSRNEKIAVGAPGHISCASVVSMLEVPKSLDRSLGDVHAAGNPHYLTDPLNGRKVAELISNSLCKIDQPSCELYKSNFKLFSAKLDSKLAEWKATLAPFKGSQIVAYHNSWPYFAERFGIIINLFLEPKPGIPPTPANLAEVITQMNQKGIHVIIVDPYLNRRTAETVARNTSAQVVDVAQFPGGVLGTEGGYIELIDHLVTSIAKALATKN